MHNADVLKAITISYGLCVISVRIKHQQMCAHPVKHSMTENEHVLDGIVYTKCEDCLANYPKGQEHECFGLMKYLVAISKGKKPEL